jgi:multidrug efflux pump subunit AcrB
VRLVAQLSGTLSDANEAGTRLIKALVLGILMLYVILYVLFENWWRPFLIMGTIPLSLTGAFWGMLFLAIQREVYWRALLGLRPL